MISDIDLPQAEADDLIAMEKVRANQDTHLIGTDRTLTMPLTSRDKRENFLLDISRGRINLQKGKYQNRGRQVVVLVRLDFGGAPHRNPDGEEIACPHLHQYREGYGDKWAKPVPTDRFPRMDDPWKTLQHFMIYCNIIEPPKIDQGLFT